MINIDNNIDKIIKLFNDHKKEIYVVGGATRDLLLGLTPLDYDLTTNALPHEIETILKGYKVDKRGKHFGSYSLVIDNLSIQITTYRKEIYSKVHYPSKVVFTDKLEEDLERRDFTINAICYANNKLIDKFDGLGDLENKLIRLIGDKALRFKEDPLRILRAIRFAIDFDFQIEKETLAHLKLNVPLISELSSNLLNKEIDKIDLIKHFKNPLIQLILPFVNYKLKPGDKND